MNDREGRGELSGRDERIIRERLSRMNRTNSWENIPLNNQRRRIISSWFENQMPMPSFFVGNQPDNLNEDDTSILEPVIVRPTPEEIDNATECMDWGELSPEDRNSIERCPISLSMFIVSTRIMKICHCGHYFKEEALREHFNNSTKFDTTKSVFRKAREIEPKLLYEAILDIINDKIEIGADDKNLIDDLSKQVINDFINEYEKLSSLSRDTLEPVIKFLINKHKTNFKGVGQPLRIALVGSKFGPGLYDVILSLDKTEVIKRLKQI